MDVILYGAAGPGTRRCANWRNGGRPCQRVRYTCAHLKRSNRCNSYLIGESMKTIVEQSTIMLIQSLCRRVNLKWQYNFAGEINWNTYNLKFNPRQSNKYNSHNPRIGRGSCWISLKRSFSPSSFILGSTRSLRASAWMDFRGKYFCFSQAPSLWIRLAIKGPARPPSHSARSSGSTASPLISPTRDLLDHLDDAVPDELPEEEPGT